MFGWGLSALSALVMAYVAWRGSGVPWIARRVDKRSCWILCTLLWGLMTTGRTLGHGTSFPGSAWLELTGMSLLGVLLLCFTMLFLVELATGFGHWQRNSAPRLRGWALLGGLALSGVASVQGIREPDVVDYQVELPNLPAAREGLVLVVLSDLHLGATLDAQWLEARITQVQALRPDLVLLLGDVFEGHGRPGEQELAMFRNLRAPLGVWAVDGNHERHDSALSPLEEAGLNVLRNAVATPIPGLVLAGWAEAGHPAAKAGEGGWKLPSVGPSEGGLILMSHLPRQAEVAARAGVGLMLSGHTHGGQIWPFGYLVRLAHPVVAGMTQIDGMALLVHRGTGTWGPRMRLWQRGEISRICLMSPSSERAGASAPPMGVPR